MTTETNPSPPYADEFYLCVRRAKTYRRTLQVRTTAEAPSLHPDEIAIKVRLVLPRVLFQRPALRAEISVPSNKVSPTVIDAEIKQNIETLVKTNLGLDMKVEIVDQTK